MLQSPDRVVVVLAMELPLAKTLMELPDSAVPEMVGVESEVETEPRGEEMIGGLGAKLSIVIVSD